MIVSAIVAMGLNNEIGKNNQLLWHLPADLKFFKNTTMGCPIIMGRKTYESIGRLLPGRKNIIISRNSNYRVEGAEIHTSVEAAINYCKKGPDVPNKIFIIGGAEIYKLAMPFMNEIYCTRVKQEFNADVFMPSLEENGFKMSWEECHHSDEKNKYDYCFQKWIKIP